VHRDNLTLPPALDCFRRNSESGGVVAEREGGRGARIVGAAYFLAPHKSPESQPQNQQQTDQSEVPDPIQERGPAQRVRFGQREDRVAQIVPQQLEHLPKQGGDEDPGDYGEDRIAQPDEGVTLTEPMMGGQSGLDGAGVFIESPDPGLSMSRGRLAGGAGVWANRQRRQPPAASKTAADTK
jgi:hypothetical protein